MARAETQATGRGAEGTTAAAAAARRDGGLPMSRLAQTMEVSEHGGRVVVFMHTNIGEQEFLAQLGQETRKVEVVLSHSDPLRVRGGNALEVRFAAGVSREEALAALAILN